MDAADDSVAGRGAWADGWRLALGTLTVVRTSAPARVDRGRAGRAMALAAIAVSPLALGVGLTVFLSALLSLPSPLAGLLAIAVLALGSRGLHLDGLADTADGLAASYDRQRSLQVMKSGTCGPAGVVTLVITLALQAFGIASLVNGATGWRAALAVSGLVAIAVSVSRMALAMCCRRGVPAARDQGLGASFAESVGGGVVLSLWLVGAGLLAALAELAGTDWWLGITAAVVAATLVTVLIRRVGRRFGGVTGDVFGAAVELSFAAILVVLAIGQ